MALEDIDSLNEKELGQGGHADDHKKIVRGLKSVKGELELGKKLYAPKSSTLTGDSVIKAMGSKAPYSAPLISSLPTITQGTTNTSTLTKQISYTSSAYLWPGFVDTTGGAATPRGRSTNAGVKASSCESTQVSFDFDGQKFDFKLKASTGTKWRIWVDGLATSSTLVPIPSETNATAIILVDLGSTSLGKPRQITVELESVSSPILFYGVNISPSDTLVFPRKPGPRVMVVGDSYGHGIGANFYAEGYARSLGRIMGWLDVWHSVTSCPSSGLVKAASVNNGAYITRINYDVIPFAPDVVIIQSSINDYESVGQNLIGPALTNYINTLKAALPNVIIIVTSPFYPASSPAAYVQIRDETKAAAIAAGVPYLDVLARAVFGGTGRAGTPVGDGNADIYRGSDGTHPTKEGHWMAANQLAALLSPALGLDSN